MCVYVSSVEPELYSLLLLFELYNGVCPKKAVKWCFYAALHTWWACISLVITVFVMACMFDVTDSTSDVKGLIACVSQKVYHVMSE